MQEQQEIVPLLAAWLLLRVLFVPQFSFFTPSKLTVLRANKTA